MCVKNQRVVFTSQHLEIVLEFSLLKVVTFTFAYFARLVVHFYCIDLHGLDLLQSLPVDYAYAKVVESHKNINRGVGWLKSEIHYSCRVSKLRFPLAFKFIFCANAPFFA